MRLVIDKFFRNENLPNFTNDSENSKIPLKPRFCVLAVRGMVVKVTNKEDSLE